MLFSPKFSNNSYVIVYHFIIHRSEELKNKINWNVFGVTPNEHTARLKVWPLKYIKQSNIQPATPDWNLFTSS